MCAWFKLLIFFVSFITYIEAQRQNNNFDSNDQVGGHRGNSLSQGFNQQNQQQQGGQPSIEQLKQSLNELQDILQHEKDGTRFGGGGFLSSMTSAGRGFCNLLYAFNGRGNGGFIGGSNWDRPGYGHQGGFWSGGRRPGYGHGSNGYDDYGYDRREGNENNNNNNNRRQQGYGQPNQSSNENTGYGYNDNGRRG